MGYLDELYREVSCAAGCDVTSGAPITVGAAGTVTPKINFTLTSGGSLQILPSASLFTSITGATSATGPIPAIGATSSATVGSVTFTVAPGGTGLAVGRPTGEWYEPLPGEEIALGVEALQATFAAPVTAMGFYFFVPAVTMPEHGG